jgi:hypothetical protein
MSELYDISRFDPLREKAIPLREGDTAEREGDGAEG